MYVGKILLVENDAETRESWARALRHLGFTILEADTSATAAALLDRTPVDAVVSELELPDGSGLPLLAHAQKRKVHTPILFVTGPHSFRSAIRAVKSGAADVLEKPVGAPEIAHALRPLFMPSRTCRASSRARATEIRPVAKSAAMKRLLSIVKRVSSYDASVLLYGESGAGKEVIAREIHRLSPRAAHPFVAMNCALLSEDLLEDQLFGHERGAFTSANERKIGVFEASDRGSLFLDEVNEIGLACQAKLLRAIEWKEFRRMGGTKKVRVNSRLMFATNVSLEEEVKAGRFREDLYYRIKVLTLEVPPLRERREDILPLARMFLDEIRHTTGRSVENITSAAIAKLMAHPWPGNVRELKNVVESATLMTEGESLDLEDLPPTLHIADRNNNGLNLPFGITMQEAERQLILHYLKHFSTKKEAARALNIGLRTLYFKLKHINSLH